MAAHTYNGAARGVSMKKKKPRLILKIVHYLIIITTFLVVVFLVLSLGFRSAAIHEAVRKDAEVLFVQTRQAFAAMDNTKDEINGKNTFSYIFTLLKTDSDTDLYAVDPGTGKIVGSTSAEMIGKRPAEIGLPMPDVSKGTAAEHGTVNGRYSYCVFSMAGDIADGCSACWISDVNKFTCAGETEASSGHRENGIASAEKFCKSTPGMSMSK